MTAIGRLRLERGLTQKEFAVAVGKSKSTVRGWEHGDYRPSDQDFPKIAEVLGCSVTMHGLSGKVHYPLPDISVLSLDALMEAGFDLAG